jgi:hypothetical protein
MCAKCLKEFKPGDARMRALIFGRITRRVTRAGCAALAGRIARVNADTAAL